MFVNLTAGQAAIVRATIARVIAREKGDPKRAATICVETEIVESGIRILANPNVPESMAIAHEGVGEDHLSVGPYQQQVPMWGTARDCMDPAASTNKFLDHLLGFNWRPLPTGVAAQDVQVSAFPDRYQAQEALATQILIQLWPAAGADSSTARQLSEEDDDMILILLAGSPNGYWLSGGKALPSITNGERLAWIAKHPDRWTTWGPAQFNLGLQGWR